MEKAAHHAAHASPKFEAFNFSTLFQFLDADIRLTRRIFREAANQITGGRFNLG